MPVLKSRSAHERVQAAKAPNQKTLDRLPREGHNFDNHSHMPLAFKTRNQGLASPDATAIPVLQQDGPEQNEIHGGNVSPSKFM